MKRARLQFASLACALTAACASGTQVEPGSNAPPDRGDAGQIIGTPPKDSKFARLRIGMRMSEVQNILERAPDRFHTYESGKGWIPFYYGTDIRRLRVLFRGEGCLVFTGGNYWGSGGGDLIQIHVDPSGACYPL
jgi:hypothetical protein